MMDRWAIHDSKSAPKRTHEVLRSTMFALSALLMTHAVWASGGLSTEARQNGSPTISFRESITLAEEYRWAQDVAWDGRSEIIVAAGRSGLVRYRVDHDNRIAPIGPEVGCPISFAAFVAVSGTTLVAAGPNHELAWRPRDRAGWTHYRSRELDLVLDIDLSGDRLGWLGALRDSVTGEYSPDGAIAWTAKLEKGLADRRPMLYSELGPGTPSMNLCGCLMLGAVSFLSDRSFVVVPGVEPGAYAYDSEGGAMWAVDLATAGVSARCDVSQAEHYVLARDLGSRFDLRLNRRAVVEDIIHIRNSPYAIVRQFGTKSLYWDIIRLGPAFGSDNPARSVIPITVDNMEQPNSRIRCDSIDKNVVVLLTNFEIDTNTPPRLILLEVTQ